MAFVLVRHYWTTVIFVTVTAFNIIAYVWPDTPYIGVLSEPLTAFAMYVIAFAIFFIPIYKRWGGLGAFMGTIFSVIIAWGVVWWWYLPK